MATLSLAINKRRRGEIEVSSATNSIRQSLQLSSKLFQLPAAAEEASARIFPNGDVAVLWFGSEKSHVAIWIEAFSGSRPIQALFENSVVTTLNRKNEIDFYFHSTGERDVVACKPQGTFQVFSTRSDGRIAGIRTQKIDLSDGEEISCVVHSGGFKSRRWFVFNPF